ncbi:TPA: PTS sugar transporter subunit IIC [Staphylococcus delphini]|uniref:PTS sugar transporter subunit IIC n=1 Tax=Staphylococcus delphini TaxID=53344 RepID=UPI000BBBA2EC|nr:PTS sugar transporter subunit IIC [Staphylococcus delphini]PCF46010.1 PTS cellobiose transporter subunit IIC [Staphylococcus delphini]PCF73326.1 PTS cellobiose transporter subunit IIC [Staphylococcus delphini]HEC2155956.1 PTS sugar transporter subunit IIC [Staphylococcus delphini]HEC2176128.1 PTS sugar transporter subunit IIC [Staphylococcus delphini]
MNKLIDKKIMPLAVKFSTNKVLVAIRDGLSLTMILAIVGSIFMLIASLPIPGWPEYLDKIGISQYLWKGVDSTFSLVGLIASFSVAWSYAKQYQQDGVAIGIIALCSFLTVTPFIKTDTASGITLGYLGAKGMFTAIIIALVSVHIYKFFIDRDIKIKLPDSVPPAVSRSFVAIIPGIVIFTLWLSIYAVLDAFKLPNAHDLITTALGGPIGFLGGSVFGTAIIVALNSLFWFVGINGGSAVNSIMAPVWLGNLQANMEAYKANEPMQYIFTQPFMDNYVYMGGGGATLGLVIAITIIARRRKVSKRTKALAPITLVPGLFNINEPAMFGLPIVLNVFLFIPFVFTPVINLFIAYFATLAGLVPYTRATATWTMPPIISGFLTTGSISASILQAILIVIDILIYIGFYAAIEKSYLKEERDK